MRKNFSLLLALRYLNPLRSHVSVITLISLAGVAIGVTVLLVVLSVYGGFEHLVKDRILSATPHMTLRRVLLWPSEEDVLAGAPSAHELWSRVAKDMQAIQGVESAYALVNDWVLLDVDGSVAPVSMQAIDTSQPSQVKALGKLIESGSADMGLGEVAVLSSLTAEKFNVGIGDTLSVHTNRNLQQVQPILQRMDTPSLWESQQDKLSNVLAILDHGRAESQQEALAEDTIDVEELKALYNNVLLPLSQENIREKERAVLNEVLDRLASGQERGTRYFFKKGTLDAAIETLKSLAFIQVDAEDAREMKELKSLVLPKDLTVVGIYKATRHAMSPELFVPLPVGQDLTGLGDGVIGVALRLKDPYHALEYVEAVKSKLPKDGSWSFTTWMDEHQQQFDLIATQRYLLTFSLSFIMLVSAFSIMAVSFTVTIQKKREMGVMKALGATSWQIVGIFLYQGLIIGFLGGVGGMGLAHWVIVKRQGILDAFAAMGFEPFPADFNGFEGLPAIESLWEYLAVFAFSFLSCAIATTLPALLIARRDAATALRNQ